MVRSEASSNLKRKVAQSSCWTLISTPFNAAIRMTGNIVLAYFLLPEFFGLAALVTVFLIGFTLLSDFGTNESLIRSSDGENPIFYNTVWSINIARGCILFLVASLTAPYIASFYDQPQLMNLLRFGALSLIFSGFTSTSIALLQRNLIIRPIVIIESFSLIVSVIVMITWAYFDPSPWALVVGSVLNEGLKSASSHLFFRKHKNSIQWDKTAISEVFNFGKWIFLSTFFTFFAMQSDKLILGHLLSIDDLGVYHVAASVQMVAYQLFGSLSGKVIFPIMSHYSRGDLKEFRNKILEIRSLLMPIIILVCAIVMIMVPSFFMIYKSSYHSAGRICQYLMLVGWTIMVQDCLIKAPLALGQPHMQALLSLTITICRIIFVLIGYYFYSLEGFIIGMAVGSYIGYSAIYLWGRNIGISMFFSDTAYGALIAGIFLINRWIDNNSNSFHEHQIMWSLLIAVMMILVFSWFMWYRFYYYIEMFLNRFTHGDLKESSI